MGYRDGFKQRFEALVDGQEPVDGNGQVDDVLLAFEGLDVSIEANKELKKQIIDRTSESVAVQASQSRITPEDTDRLFRVLDFVVALAEKGECDEVLPLSCLSAVMEVEPLASTSLIFRYIESRQVKLTTGMTAGRGKGPVLLRLLNELLRRLPKSKPEHVIFAGRILFFLSRVFPLPQAEKSGVNLRGNFNVTKAFAFDSTAPAAPSAGEEHEEEGEMRADVPLHDQFWSLQSFFINPALLFVPALPAQDPLNTLNTALTRTLDVFRDATEKEKAVSSTATRKRKANEMDEEEHHFFPKFLTSPNLLDLEIRDPNFRFQILLQCLFLFRYVLSFTPAARNAVLPVKNAPAFPAHVLPPAHEKTANELLDKTWTALRSMQGGDDLERTARRLLERDDVWIKWKLASCQRFDLPSLPAEQAKVASEKANALTRRPKAYPNKMGNANLSVLWQKAKMLNDEAAAENRSGERFDEIVREWTLATKKLQQKRLAGGDEWELTQLEMKVSALEWRALRVGSVEYLPLYSTIQKGDLKSLVDAIEQERLSQEATTDAEAATQEAGTTQLDDVTAVQGADVVVNADVDAEPGQDKVDSPSVADENEITDDKEEALVAATITMTDEESSVVSEDHGPFVLIESSPKRKRAQAEEGEGEDVGETPAKRVRIDTTQEELSSDDDDDVVLED